MSAPIGEGPITGRIVETVVPDTQIASAASQPVDDVRVVGTQTLPLVAIATRAKSAKRRIATKDAAVAVRANDAATIGLASPNGMNGSATTGHAFDHKTNGSGNADTIGHSSNGNATKGILNRYATNGLLLEHPAHRDIQNGNGANGHPMITNGSGNGHSGPWPALGSSQRTSGQPADAETLDWCLEVGETVLSAPASFGATSPEEALQRYIDGVEERKRSASPRLFATNKTPENLALAQRIDRLSMQMRRPRAQVIDWAVCIGVTVLSDPVAGQAVTPGDALAAHVLRAFAIKFGSGQAKFDAGLHAPSWRT